MSKQLTRRQFMNRTAAATALFSLSFHCAKPAKPNILWLISEDTSPDFACYGNQSVKTPYIDKFASEGVRFTRAFSTCPVCSPVRSGFMTGMYQTTIGAHNHRTRIKKSLPEPVRVITHYFKQSGYFTANVTNPAPDVEGTGKTDWNFEPLEDPFDGKDWNALKTNQPFFAQVNFKMTHRIFQRDPDNPVDPNTVDIPPYYPDHPITRRDWADYLESLQVLDKQIGKVLEQLEKDGLAENTIVVYFGDHGRPHVRGKQWLYEGGICIPLIIRWPNHFKAGTVNEELVSTIDFAPTCMELVGIQPPEHLQGNIFLGKNTQERLFIVAARDRCDETVDRIRCIRDKRFKYIRNFMPERPYMQLNSYKRKRYPVFSLLQVLKKQNKLTPVQLAFMRDVRPVEELYDLDNDPYEINNLASNPEFKQQLESMRLILMAWIKETGDQGEIPEPKEEIEYWWNHQMERDGQALAERGLSNDSPPEDFVKYWNNRFFGQE